MDARALGLNFLAWVLYPLWLAAGAADYLCHRRTHIERTSGAVESWLHVAQFLSIAALLALATLFAVTTERVDLVARHRARAFSAVVDRRGL